MRDNATNLSIARKPPRKSIHVSIITLKVPREKPLTQSIFFCLRSEAFVLKLCENYIRTKFADDTFEASNFGADVYLIKSQSDGAAHREKGKHKAIILYVGSV